MGRERFDSLLFYLLIIGYGRQCVIDRYVNKRSQVRKYNKQNTYMTIKRYYKKVILRWKLLNTINTNQHAYQYVILEHGVLYPIFLNINYYN